MSSLLVGIETTLAIKVKQISAHNQIIALYDYGVGTYDFDMSIVQPQIKLAQAKAEENVIDFFEKK